VLGSQKLTEAQTQAGKSHVRKVCPKLNTELTPEALGYKL